MTFYRIKSAVLTAEGHRFETIDRKAAEGKLVQIHLRDPNAKLLKLETNR